MTDSRKKWILRSLSIALAAIIIICALATPQADARSSSEYYENAVLFWTNVERERAGLSSLSTTDTLAKAAGTRASEISDSFSHTRPNGTKCYTALTNLGLTYRYAAENIAAGQDTPAEAVTAWMNSEGHRTNILNSKYTYVGVGYYYENSGYKDHWEQMFSGGVNYSGAYGVFYVAPTSISADKSSVSLAVGGTTTVTGTPSPVYATEKVNFISSNTSVLQVTNTQVNVATIKGVANGVSKLTVQCGNYSVTVKVTVGSGGGFTDVPTTSPFYSAINWAVQNGITNGYSDGSFGPNETCTKAQAITFIWRAAGKPEPASGSNPFADVSSSSPYYKAILWANEKGIASAEYGNSFVPNSSCSRVDAVTYLWRSAGRPAASGSGFSDTRSLSGDEQSAIKWAVQNGIAGGYSNGTFEPNANCTRAHVVTFLYRYYN